MTSGPPQGKLPEQGPGSVSNTEELENRSAGAAYAEPSVTGEVHKLQLYIADPPVCPRQHRCSDTASGALSWALGWSNQELECPFPEPRSSQDPSELILSSGNATSEHSIQCPFCPLLTGD